MRLSVGSYQFEADQVGVAWFSELLRNAAGTPYARRNTLTAEGWLIGNGQSDLTQKESALRTALSLPYQDIVLKQDSGADSPLALRNAGSITGVLVTDVRFPSWRGGEYATFRSFQFSAEAEYPLAATELLLLDYTEVLEIQPSGPRRVVLEARAGPPQPQVTTQQTAWRATQEGRAVGYRRYPTVPPAIWPAALVEPGRVRRTSPRPRRFGAQEFAVEWRFEFAAAGPLVGLPHTWPA